MSEKKTDKAPIIFENKHNCCGCTACYNACPVNAITMTADEEEFLYPKVNKEKCIGCNKCINVCNYKFHQYNNGYINTAKNDSTVYPIVYAAKHKDFDIRINSRSGGVFTALSDNILIKKGVVYGCVLTDDFKAIHSKATSPQDRDKMRGSKYIQSSLNNIFKDVYIELEKNIPVLFSGTSCQIDGLKSFLSKEYDNLLCVDIVCHGVPSPKIWNEYLKWQEQRNNAKCTGIDFRNKIDHGWKAHIETLTMNKNDNSVIKIDSEIFKSLFYSHNVLRPSCYHCPYKSTIHPGDITIADYWGIDKAAPGFNDDKGVSLILINNEKGKKIFESVLDNLDYQNCKIEDSMQPPLIKPFPKPIERDMFWKDFENKGFDFIVKKYVNKSKSYKTMLYCLKARRAILRLLRLNQNT